MANEKFLPGDHEARGIVVQTRSANASENFVPGGHDTRRIAVEARCGVRAVRAVYRGDHVKELTRIRVLEAVARLGLPLPSDAYTDQHDARIRSSVPVEAEAGKSSGRRE